MFFVVSPHTVNASDWETFCPTCDGDRGYGAGLKDKTHGNLSVKAHSGIEKMVFVSILINGGTFFISSECNAYDSKF
jgi:hypothetical protein